jgi:hypothetical protein
MPNEEFDEREEALRYAAGLNGLSLVRTGDTFALAHYKLTGATLDEIAAFLGTDGGPERRHADLRAMLKAEHAMIAKLEEAKRTAKESSNVAWQDIKHSANSLR